MISDEEIETIFKKGPALVFENDRDCLGKYLHADELKKIVAETEIQLDFVFMATCHSEFAAKIFLEAGAQHVIGINHEQPVKDDAIITFTQTFYSILWNERSQICKCFEIAKLAVQISHGKEEASKFVKFTFDVDMNKKDSHKCNIYGNFQEGKPAFFQERGLLWDLPPKIDGYFEQ